MPYHSRQVSIICKKQGIEENILSIECDIFDMSAYVDLFRRCINDDICDYIIIEPYKLKSLFPDEVY